MPEVFAIATIQLFWPSCQMITEPLTLLCTSVVVVYLWMAVRCSPNSGFTIFRYRARHANRAGPTRVRTAGRSWLLG